MRDKFPRQVVYSRQAFASGTAKVRQLAAMPRSEIPPGRSYQFFNPAEVLNEPQARGRKRLWLGRHPLQPIIRLLENALVVPELD
jgi:hypothetical protein